MKKNFVKSGIISYLRLEFICNRVIIKFKAQKFNTFSKYGNAITIHKTIS